MTSATLNSNEQDTMTEYEYKYYINESELLYSIPF